MIKKTIESAFKYNPYQIQKMKLVSAYLKKKEINFGFREKYDFMSILELEQLIKSEFVIKGKLNWKTMMKAKKTTDTPLEKEEQQKFIKWLKENKIGHFANGLGVKLDYDVKYMASLRSQGHYKGLPDMTILLGNGKVIFVEMKRTKGGVVSEEQKKWIEYLNKNGYPAKVCKGCEEAIKFVEENK